MHRIAVTVALLLTACRPDPSSPSIDTVTPDETPPDSDAPSGDTGDTGDTDTDAEPFIEGSRPEIQLTEPMAVGWLEHQEDTLDISGTASVSTSAVRWSTDAGEAGAASGTSSWSASVVLSSGLQLLTVTASDADAQEGSAALWVLREGEVDFNGPITLDTEVTAPGETVQASLQLSGSGAAAVDAVMDCGDGEVRTTMTGSATEWIASLTAPSETTVCWVQAEADGERSLPTVLRVQPTMTEAEAEDLLATMSDAAAALESGTAVADLASALLARAEIASAGFSDDKLWWVSTSGILNSITIVDGSSRGGGSSRAAMPPVPSSTQTPGIHPNPELRFYSPFSDEFAPNDEVTAWLVPQSASLQICGQTPTTTHLDRAAVTPASYLSMGGTTHISSHGGTFWAGACSAAWPLPAGAIACPSGWGATSATGDFALFARETPTASTVLSNQSDLMTWRMGIGGVYNSSTFVTTFHYTVQPGYFDKHLAADALEGSVVAISACESTRTTSMATVLMRKGVQAYIGFDDVVYSNYANAFMSVLYSRWWNYDVDLDAAFAYAQTSVGVSDPTPPNATSMNWSTATVLPLGPMSVLSNADHQAGSWTWVESCLADIEGQINSSGGDAVGSHAPGDGGEVVMFYDDSRFSQAPTGVNLVIPEGDTALLSAGVHAYDEVRVEGTLELEGDVFLTVPGSVYIAPTGQITHGIGTTANLSIDAGGVVIVDGLIDLSGAHAYSSTDTTYQAGGSLSSCFYDTDGVAGAGEDGGAVFITQHSEPLVVPTITALGGDANDYDPQTQSITGGHGGGVDIIASTGRAYLLGGAIDPALWTQATVSKTYRPYGCDLSGHTVSAIQPNLPEFTEGIVTSGGQGPRSVHSGSDADADGYGGSGGDGGDVNIFTTTGSLVFQDIDIATGAATNIIETAPNMRSLDDVASFENPTGGQGGYGNFGSLSSGGEGGNGGTAGDITISGPSNAVSLHQSIAVWGWDGDNPNDHYPSATTINVLGHFQTYHDSSSDTVLRAWAAGGSGGTPGGTSVYNKFPGWFGYAGASGTVTVTQ